MGAGSGGSPSGISVRREEKSRAGGRRAQEKGGFVWDELGYFSGLGTGPRGRGHDWGDEVLEGGQPKGLAIPPCHCPLRPGGG